MSSPSRIRALSGALVTVALVGVTSCSSGPVTPTGSPAPSASSSPSPTPTAEPGVTLRQLGFANGPAELRLPTGIQLTTSADQSQQVTLVISSPAPSEVSGYLRRTLPATGFAVARQQDDAIEFSGHGWAGSFVATGSISAVTLQPQ